MSLVQVSLRLRKKGWLRQVTIAPWYPKKVHASFADALASLRRHLWGRRIMSMFGKRPGHAKNLEFLLEALARAA